MASGFLFLDQLHDIANVPKALFKAAGHGRGHANRAVHAGEVIHSWDFGGIFDPVGALDTTPNLIEVKK
jgi:hypothetical protein